MLVKDIMTEDVKTCHQVDDLESIATQMSKFDMGFVPIVNEKNQVTGVITDRDIVMCAAKADKAFRELKSEDVTKNRPLHSCKANDNIETALNVMRSKQLHRLPVIDEQGKIKGVLGLADIIGNTGKAGKNQVSPDDTLKTLKSIYSS